MPKKTIIWIYSQNKTWDFGFVDVEWIDKGFYVFPFNKKDALDWDEVEAEVKMFKWKEEAVVIRVKKRADKTLIWEFQMWKTGKFGFVKIKDEAFKKDIFVPWKYSLNAKNWDIVWVKISKWEWKNPEGKVEEVLWEKWDNSIDVKWFILEAGFKEWFSDKITRELKSVSDKISKNELARRKDFRNLFTFTLDWEDA